MALHCAFQIKDSCLIGDLAIAIVGKATNRIVDFEPIGFLNLFLLAFDFALLGSCGEENNPFDCSWLRRIDDVLLESF